MISYPPPRRVQFPLMYQRWCGLSFLHWRVPLSSVSQLVPAPLEVETFDGSAWVGLTPFCLRGLHPPLMPALPWLSAFPETNCRTYVRGPDGEAGIWFFSLDAARAAAVIGARAGFGLPYAWSRMRVRILHSTVRYESFRRWPDRSAMARIEIETGDSVASGDAEIFLTGRYRFYSFIAGKLTYTEVEHPPWPLHQARVVRLEQTITEAAGLPPMHEPPLAHFSPGVAVRVAFPKAFALARHGFGKI